MTYYTSIVAVTVLSLVYYSYQLYGWVYICDNQRISFNAPI